MLLLLLLVVVVVTAASAAAAAVVIIILVGRPAKALSAPTPTRSDQNDFGACRAWSLSNFARSINSHRQSEIWDIYRALVTLAKCAKWNNCDTVLLPT